MSGVKEHIRTSRSWLRYALICLAMTLPLSPGQAQDATARAMLEKDTMLIGDQFQYVLELMQDRNLRVWFPEYPDTLVQNIEILERSSRDTVHLENDRLAIRQSFLITCFDSGYYQIPGQPFRIEATGQEIHLVLDDEAHGQPYAAGRRLRLLLPHDDLHRASRLEGAGRAGRLLHPERCVRDGALPHRDARAHRVGGAHRRGHGHRAVDRHRHHRPGLPGHSEGARPRRRHRPAAGCRRLGDPARQARAALDAGGGRGQRDRGRRRRNRRHRRG